MIRRILLLFSVLLIIAAMAEPMHAKTEIAKKITDNIMIEVWPETRQNPEHNWQYITVNSAKKNDLKYALRFYDDVEIIAMQEVHYNPDNSTTFSDIIMEYDKEKILNTVKYAQKLAKSQNKGETRTIRIKYKPKLKSGKWDMEVEDNNKKFRDVLDPWWESVNTTQGYVYLTNITPFAETWESYNATYDFTNRWTILNGTWQLAQVGNGFGYNTTNIYISNSTTTYHYLNKSEMTYNNYEYIFQVQRIADFGSDRNIFSTSGKLDNNSITFYASTMRVYDDVGGFQDDGSAIGIDDVIIVKYVVNNSVHSVYRSDDFGESFALVYNYTSNNPAKKITYVCRQAACAYDNIIIRELVPYEVNSTELYASLIYQDAENDSWSNATIQWLESGNPTHTAMYQNPNDFTIFNHTLSAGIWQANVSVCDVNGNCAWNLSQSINLSGGVAPSPPVNVTPVNATIWIQDIVLLPTTTSLSCYANISLLNKSNTNLTFFWYNGSGVQLVNGTKVCEHNNVCTVSTINNTYIANNDNFTCEIKVRYNSTTYNFTSAVKSRTEFGECTGTAIYPVVNISYYDEITSESIYVDAYLDVQLYDGVGYFDITQGYTNVTYVQLCSDINPLLNTITLEMSGDLYGWKTDYVTRILSLPEARAFTVSNNPVYNYSLYMVQINQSTTMTYTWFTINFEPIDGTMLIYRCEKDGTRVLVESVPIIAGVATANLVLYTQPYSYEVVIDDEIYAESNYAECHVESQTSREFYVDTSTTDLRPVAGLLGVTCSIYNTSGSTVRMQWNSNSNDPSDITGCIVGYRTTSIGRTEIYRDCLTAPQGSFIRTIPVNQYSYVVQGELTQGNFTSYCQSDVSFNIKSDFSEKIGIEGPLIVGLAVMGLGMMFMTSGLLMITMAGAVVVISFVAGFIMIGWEVVMIILTLIGMAALIGRYTKKRQEE